MLTGLLAGCNHAVSEPIELSDSPVKLITIDIPSDTTQSDMIAYLDAGERSDLSFQVPGYLKKLHVTMGQKVTQGDLIAELDAQDYRLAVTIKQAEFDLAKASYARSKRLYSERLISKDAYENELSAFESAQAQLRMAKKDLKNTRLYADFSGVISSKSVSSYQVVGAGQTIVSLVDPNIVEATAVLPVDEYNQIGKQALLSGKYKLTLAGNGKPSFNAKFKEISNQPDSDTNSYQLTVSAQSADDIKWVPGMSATLALSQSTNTKALTIQDSAWVDKSGLTGTLFVYDPSNKTAVRRTVTLDENGAVTGGIVSGDLVVVAGAQELNDGQSVRPWVEEGGI